MKFNNQSFSLYQQKFNNKVERSKERLQSLNQDDSTRNI